MSYRRPSHFDVFSAPRSSDAGIEALVAHFNNMAVKLNEMNTVLERTHGEQELTINNIVRGGGAGGGSGSGSSAHTILSHSDALSTAITPGSILAVNGVTQWAELAVGVNDQYLRVVGGMPTWDSITTDDVPEGTNLYWTQARFDTAFAAKSTTDLAEGTNLYYTAERVQDEVANLIDNTASIVWTYNDPGNTFTADVQANTTVQKVAVRKNSTGGDIGTRRRLNFIEGTNITLTITDDAGADDEIDITIDSSGSGAHDILSASHSDTLADSVVRGDIIYGNATPKWARLPIGASTFILTSDGTDVSWQAPPAAAAHDLLSATHSDTLAAAVSRGSLIVGNTTPAWSELVIGAANRVLHSDGTDATWAALVDADIPDTLTITAISNLTTNGFVKTGGGVGTLSVDTNTYLTSVTAHALLSATHNDTAASAVSRGSIIVGNATPAWAEVTIGGANTVLHSNGTDAAWAALVDADIPNTLTITAISNLTTNGFVKTGGGVGTLSVDTNTYLTSVTAHALLSATHSDTLAAGVSRGSLIVGNTTPAWSELVIGAANRVLRSNGTDASWAQVTLTTDVTGILPMANGGTNANLTASAGGIVWTDAGSMEVLAGVAVAGRALVSGNAATPSWFNPSVGSVIFAGTSGILEQDNSQFFWDNSSNRLGILTSSPDMALTVLVGTAAGNTGAHIGPVYIGNFIALNNHATFSHEAVKATTGSFAMIQNSSGATYINAADNQALTARINNGTTGGWAVKEVGGSGWVGMSVGDETPIDTYRLNVAGELRVAESLNLNPNAANYTTVGDYYYHSTDYALRFTHTARTCGAVLHLGTMTATSSNLTSATIGNFTGAEYAIAANGLNSDGNMIRVTAWGEWDHRANADTLTISVRYGSTVIGSYVMTAAVALVDDRNWKIEFHIIIRTTGAAATWYTSAWAMYDNGSAWIATTTKSTGTVDLTAGQLLALAGTWSTANAENVANLFGVSFELLNAEHTPAG